MFSESIPGADLIQKGLDDLASGRESIEALLVRIGAPRLRRLGIPVPADDDASPELKLYERLASIDADSAHSRYNALIRHLVSFDRATECARS